MQKVETLHSQYLDAIVDENNQTHYQTNIPQNFNFAYDVIDKIAELEPDRRAIVWCNAHGEEKFFSYKDVRDYSNKAANLFLSKGVKKGDMVMLVLKRHYQFWFAVLGLHKIGAVAVPATDLLTVKDYVYRFEAATIEHIVATSDGAVTARIDEADNQCKLLKNKFVVGKQKEEWLDFNELLEEQSSELERQPNTIDDNLLLYFTSGTTGYPKMVVHTHDYPIAHIITAKYWHNVQPDGLHLTVSDTGWAKSMWGKLYGQMFLGAAIFVYDYDKFNPSQLLENIEKYQVTSFCAPPTIYRFFIKEGMGHYDFSSVKYATTAGEALNAEVYNRFKELTGLKLVEGFGQTETTLLIFNPVGTQPKPGAMGIPSGLYVTDLVNDAGESVPQGTVGEIVVKIPEEGKQLGLFKEYYRNPQLTEGCVRHGYYHTGDTAWVDEDGYYWFVGRTDDVIKASGYRIGPFEIESVLMEHPAVMECAVTGTPDPEGIRGIVVKATIVLTSAYTACPELAKELQDYVKKETAPYKYPRVIEFVTELPKTISGKIKRAEIREEDIEKLNQ